MKRLLFLLLFALPVCAQTKAFTARDNAMVWENVFVTDEANVAAILEKHPSLTITSQKGSVYSGVAKNVKNSCPGTSDAFIDAIYNFSFEIEKSAGMYRVTISKLKILPVGTKRSFNAERFFIDKNHIKTGPQTETDLACLDAFFNRIFAATALLKNKP